MGIYLVIIAQVFYVLAILCATDVIKFKTDLRANISSWVLLVCGSVIFGAALLQP